MRRTASTRRRQKGRRNRRKPMPIRVPLPARFSFLTKSGLALALVALADQLLFDASAGSVLGLCGLAWALATAWSHPALRHDARALFTFGVAVSLAIALALDPSLLGWLLFWTALSMAVLLPRTARFGDGWQWARKLLLHGVTSLLGPVTDYIRIRRVRHRTNRLSVGQYLPALVLPLLGGTVFLSLFALANPLISNALGQIRLPGFGMVDVARLLFWVASAIIVWGSLRPRRLRLRINPLQSGPAKAIAGVSVASVTLSLLLFNALFALQNGLDLVYLWSGAGLPDGMTLAEYAHRGAYPLIATALLAGLFVLVTTQPGSPMAANRLIRMLVSLWVIQNVFLVASSMLRTLDYVELYSLTVLRISALLWMGLVALGLVLIVLRMLGGKSAAWLVNTNAAAALVLLGGCSFTDLSSIAARWNVEHAREVGGKSVWIDLCYLNEMDGSALLPLATLEQHERLTPEFRDRVSRVRQSVEERVRAQQADWRSWEWRDARRLSAMPQGLRKMPNPGGMVLQCDGTLVTGSDTRN
jgi:Domain of unknown function (DUF4173)